jgi:hemerythrin
MAEGIDSLEREPLFQFTDECRIGVPIIDAEHEHLFSIMNQLLDSILDADRNVVEIEEYKNLLIEYGNTHFAHEEEYMEKIGDRELIHQKIAHSQFMNKVHAIDVMDLTDEEKRPIAIDVMEFTIQWLYRHILYSDTLIGSVTHLADHKDDVIEESTAENSVISEGAASDEERRKELMYCKFLPKFRTRVPEIDEEHQILFEIIDDAYTLLEDGYDNSKYDTIMSILDRLEEYTATHFAHEEEIMRTNKYPDLKKQEIAHKIFLERMAERDMSENEADHRQFLEELLDFLYAWLSNHISKMDTRIGDFLHSKKRK